MSQVKLRAHAKINLNLRIIGRRPDGYHDIDTIVQTISLHDSLTLEPAQEGIALEVDDPAVPSDASNLVWRAAQEVARAASRPVGTRIRLEKTIPVGAGLGGGSSDAAAALVGLCRLWDLAQGDGALSAMAARLGSDVPFFITGGMARVRGRGTEVELLADQDPYGLVVVFPGVPIATRDVYAQVQESLTPAPKIGSMTRFGLGASAEVEELVRAGNDLEPYARRLCPAVGEIKDRLLRAGAAAAAMSGSGSAVFGVFRDSALQGGAAREMRRCGWLAFPCAPLGREGYRSSLGLA